MRPYLIRRAMWGTLLIWIGVMMVVEEPAGVASLGAGIILLVGALLRRAMGMQAGFVLTVAGALLVFFGVSDLNGEDTSIPLFAVVLIAIGAFIIARGIGYARGGGPTIEIRRFYETRYGGRHRPPDDQV